MTTVTRLHRRTAQAKGLAALLRKGVEYATKQELGISDLEYDLSAALRAFEAPEFGVKATLTSNEDALQALRDSLAT